MNATNIKIGNPAPARVPQTNMSNSRRSRENVSTVVNDNISHQTYIQTQETIRDFQMQRASLEQLLRQTCEQNNINEQKVFDLQRKLDEQERVFQEQLQQSKLEMATKQRIALQENLELIRIQRELQEKTNSLTMLETQLNQTCTRLQATEAANRELVSTVNRLQQDIQAKDMELASLKAALVASSSYKLKVTALENQLADCKRENEILAKQTETIATSSLTNTSSQPTSSAPLSEIQMLREKLRQAENTVELLERERRERNGSSNSLQAALARAQAAEAEVALLRLQVTDRRSLPQSASLQALCEVVGVDMSDLETALMMLREKKLSQENDVSSKLDLLKLDDPDEGSDLQHRIRRAELEHAETIQELEKTRQLLTVQYRINKEYRAEAACATGRLADLKAESEQQLREYARLLDIRAARIHQLETQLNNIAYGTRSCKVSKPTTEDVDEAEDDSMLECEEQMALERGDNLLELHLGVLKLTDEAIDVLTKVDNSIAANSGGGVISPEELRLFCTWDFFDFETQATALVQGASADFNLTVQYPVQMDEFFLSYLHKGRCVVELYQSNNTTFRLLAASCLNLAQLLSGWEGTSTLRSPGLGQRSAGTVARRHAQANFIGVTDSATASKAQFPSVSGLTGLLVARLDYYLRLRVPMEQSIRLYLDKAKVLPLLAAFSEPDLPPFKKGLAVSEDKGDTSKARSGMFRGVNQLVISIVKASGLRSTKTDRLPSAYFVYQFYNLSEYMSMVQQATSAPVFEDVHTVSLRITPELDLCT
uniref:RPGR-interacting protein 1 first C2 domain-containing protein n=1 Tax=Schistocephalus solidus TaxID=70667 RepID=A0A0X3NHT6_SCHSO